jgi:drug/metabolite transporter (DMT)-like permease
VSRGVGSLRISRVQLRSTAALGLGIIGVWGAASSLAQRYLPSGISALVAASIPLWVVVLRAMAGDRPSRLTTVGVGIGMGGVVLMLLPGGIVPVGGASPSAVLLWSLAILGASVSWAYFSWRSRTFEVPANSLVTTAYQLLFAGSALMVLGFATGERVVPGAYTRASWLGWSWLVLASVIGYAAFTYLISTAPISLVSTFPYVNPVVAVFLGWLVLGEPISRSIVIGLTVVVGGVVLVVTGESARTRSSAHA